MISMLVGSSVKDVLDNWCVIMPNWEGKRERVCVYLCDGRACGELGERAREKAEKGRKHDR